MKKEGTSLISNIVAFVGTAVFLYFVYQVLRAAVLGWWTAITWIGSKMTPQARWVAGFITFIILMTVLGHIGGQL